MILRLIRVLRPLRAASLLAAFAALVAGAVSAQESGPVPRPDLAPALLGGAEPILAFTAGSDQAGDRVWAASPVHAGAVEVGPGDAIGDDGAPALARLADGRSLLVAARSDGDASRIWGRVGDRDGWLPVRWLPTDGEQALHPVVATGGGRTWAAWVGLDGRGRARLHAAEWRRGGWSRIEDVPVRGLRPGRPALAVGADGLPRLLWSARDANDAEIWLSHRRARRWRAPRRITANARHDLAPDAAFEDGLLVVAWETFRNGAYHPVATTLRGPRHRPGAVVDLARDPGAAPRLVPTESGLRAVWASPEATSSATLLRAALRRGDAWDGEQTLARARNARTAVASSGTSWLIGWHDAAGVSAARVVGRESARLEPLRGLARGSGADVTFELPGTYLAFGDSITAGLVRFDGIISFVDGYSVHLGRLISQQIGMPVTVDQSAVPGELTSEGLNRLRANLISQRREVVFINEGANDAANVVEPEVVLDNLVQMAIWVQDFDGLPFVGTITPRTEDGFGGGINLRIEDTNALIRQVIPGVALPVDIWQAFIGRHDLYSDHIHPNAGGYEYMAGICFRQLQPVLNDLLRNDDEERALEEDELRARLGPPPIGLLR